MSRVAEKCKGDIIMEIRNRSWEVQLALVVIVDSVQSPKAFSINQL